MENKKNYRKGDLLTITINPAPHRQSIFDFKKNPLDLESRMFQFQEKWCAIFTHWYQELLVDVIEMNLEMSHNGLLHYHGYVVIHDPLKFNHMLAYYKYPPSHSSVQIDIGYVTDITIWLEYCTKDSDIMPEKFRLSRLTGQDENLIKNKYKPLQEGSKAGKLDKNMILDLEELKSEVIKYKLKISPELQEKLNNNKNPTAW